MGDAPVRDFLWPVSLHAYDVTLSSAMENLALDEALLAGVDADPTAACLRFWQPEQYFIVLGRSNQEQTEVNLDACSTAGIPIFRRSSGGGAVIVGPGCLCYSLVLPAAEVHRSSGVSRVTADLMSRTADGLRQVLRNVEVCGTSDLVWNGLKFSGNAQRWLRNSFIHHGTLLFDFDLSLCGRFLNHPTREPGYRASRRHADFLTNIPLQPEVLRECVCSAWNAVPATFPAVLRGEAIRIAAARYESDDWQISSRT